ncbi:MAG TPA: TolC family protein [Rhabdochlamydiaceae bacterium]|nr:TolC family protein [Rhabdochlamydiaceae bacterium]
MRLSKMLPCSYVLLVILSGCNYYPYPNRVVIEPWLVTPVSAQKPWEPPPEAQQHRAPLALMMPDAQEQPLTLAEVVNIALNNNPTTQITWAQARQAAAQYAQTQSSQFPTITGTMSFEQGVFPTFAPTQLNVVLTTQNYIQWGPQLQVAYTVWDFGQMRETSEAARQALYFADWTHNRAIQTLIQTISTDYYSYLYQKQLYAAYAANVETAQITLDAANVGFMAGIKDVSDVLQAKTQLLQNQTEWVAQQQAVETSYAALLNDMGLPANLCFAVEDLPTVIPAQIKIQDINELISYALQQRADLLAAEANLQSQEANIRAVRNQFWPTLTYNFDIGRMYFLQGLHDNYDYSNMVSLNIPIFSGFSTLNALRQAKAQKQQAKATLRQTELQVIKDIATSHSNVKVSFETLEFSDSFLEAAQKQYKVALAQYKAGVKTILDVVSAQSALANARATQANAIQQWFVSLSTLAYATGILSENSIAEKKAF